VTLQRHARTLHALADRWSTVTPSKTPALSPFAGAEDLNDPAALQLDGVLFMEGEGEPAELVHLVSGLRSTAEDFAATGDWLANAMQASWDVAAALADIDGLGDLLGERHRIIANDWLAADMQALVARLLRRAADILDHVDFTPTELRADLATIRRAPGLLHAAAEIINRAADLCSDSAGLVNDNERRWRVFRQRVAEIIDQQP
jgi:predicted trehalose synthase